MDINSPGGRNNIHSQHRLSVLLVVCFLILALIPEALATTETRYFRSDTATVNGLTTEILGTSNSATFGNRTLLINDAEASATRYYWGHRTYYRTSGGVETEITSGVSNLFYRSSIGVGWQNVNWSCPQTSISSTDSIVVKVYASLWSSAEGYAWTLLDTWQTGQLGTTIINANPWNFTVWTYLAITTGPPKKWTGAIYFGNSTYDSRILGFKYGEITKSWHSLTWTSTLNTRTWRSLSWTETLATRAWQSLAWTFDLTGKAWNSVVWILELTGKTWSSILWNLELTGKTWNELVWEISLGPGSEIPSLWIGLLTFSCLIILVFGVVLLKKG